MTLPRTPSFRLDGKRALVVGASSGIGEGCALALAEAGAEVCLAARGEERLRALAGKMARAGHRCRVLVLDISQLGPMQRAVAENGPFDILVNSAGLARHGPAHETSPEDFEAVSAVNFRGAYFLTAAVARGLIEAGRPGSLINISSQMGRVGGPQRALYCATKHAVEGFTRAMAIDYGPHGIRVNTICPTFIRTPLTEATFSDPAQMEWVKGQIRLGRTGEVSDIMGAVVYLASEASALVTGTSLMVDGGWTAG